jgi:hypothetical protein
MRAFLYITALILTGFSAFAAGGDTTKVKYDINDPRNPDCPCHKYQQMADEEYKQQLTNKVITNASEDLSRQIIQTKNETASALTALAAENVTAKSKKDATKLTGTKKINRSVFAKRLASQHKSAHPKKRKVRFGRKDNSRCSRW